MNNDAHQSKIYIRMVIFDTTFLAKNFASKNDLSLVNKGIFFFTPH